MTLPWLPARGGRTGGRSRIVDQRSFVVQRAFGNRRGLLRQGALAKRLGMQVAQVLGHFFRDIGGQLWQPGSHEGIPVARHG